MEPLKFLIVEDDLLDVELVSRTCKAAGMNFTVQVVSEGPAFEAALEQGCFDIILADNSLPQFDAVSALNIVKAKGIEVPFILVTGTVSEEFAVDVLKKGADDYILKGNLKKLPVAIESAIAKWKAIKEKALAEAALKESEQRYRILFEQAADGIMLTDKNGCLIDANSSACAITGYSLRELQRTTIVDMFFANDDLYDSDGFEELVAGKSIVCERRIKRKDGELVYVELSAKILPDGRLQAIVRDVTYRKQLEARLLSEKINHQKKLAQATLDAQEKERTEIGKELHDNVNQILTATKLLLTAAEQDEDIKDVMISRSIKNVSGAIDEIRKLSKSLVTPANNELSLSEAIQDLIDTIRLTTGITVHSQVQNGFKNKINRRQQIALYRIVQEQINNIIKHADAHTIQLVMEEKDNAIHMEIVDDGKGFDINAKRSGIGLTNMQSRAELLNGNLNIESVIGKGSVLKVDLPLELEAAV